MKFESAFLKTKKGITVEYRNASEEDAQLEIDYLKKVCGETRFLLSEPEDVQYTEESEKVFIKNQDTSDNALLLNAFVDGQLAGNGSFNPVSAAKRLSHRASLGVAILQEYWHLGIGEQLVALLIDKARACGFEILELEVFSTNEHAIRLYRKLGFSECGRTVNGVKYKDGTYADIISMQLFLK